MENKLANKMDVIWQDRVHVDRVMGSYASQFDRKEKRHMKLRLGRGFIQITANGKDPV